jgi:hypothetical protein
MISRSKISETCVQVLMVSMARRLVFDRMSTFGFKSSLATSRFFVIFYGAIISKGIE